MHIYIYSITVGWHYLDSSQTQIGPISLADLNERIADGQITMETYG